MIVSFADPETELMWSGLRSRRLPPDIQPAALRKLRLLIQARRLDDLRSARQPDRGAACRPAGPARDPDQRSVADLFSLE
jgi:hypothetical protein